MCECCGGDCKEPGGAKASQNENVKFRECIYSNETREKIIDIIKRANQRGLKGDTIQDIEITRAEETCIWVDFNKPYSETAFRKTMTAVDDEDMKNYTKAINLANDLGLQGRKICDVKFVQPIRMHSGPLLSNLSFSSIVKSNCVKTAQEEDLLKQAENKLLAYSRSRSVNNNVDALDAVAMATNYILTSLKPQA